MGEVVQFGDAKERMRQKAKRLLERAGFNEILIARIVGVCGMPGTPESDADPRNPNVRS